MWKTLKAIFGSRYVDPPLWPSDKSTPQVHPGEISIDRNWTDDPMTDTTVITVGGQVESAALNAIKAILKGEAHARRYGRGKELRVKRQEGIL